VERHSLIERQLEAEAMLDAGGHASAETRRSLGNPTIPRVLAGLSGMALEQGIELRAPLLDRRVVEFALRRPRRERASAGAVKHLLRNSARTLLPASVLGPRAEKTGVLTGYFSRSLRGDPENVVTDAFSQSILADRGIVDGATLQHAWREYKGRGGGGGAYLYVAFMTEMWLRARDVTSVASTDVHANTMTVPAVGFVQ
jgi:asparagine synthetase B (glutamine-hydrolysing)